jgi:hypothetical protein
VQPLDGGPGLVVQEAVSRNTVSPYLENTGARGDQSAVSRVVHHPIGCTPLSRIMQRQEVFPDTDFSRLENQHPAL